MLNDCIGNKQWKFADGNQISQQQSVFGPDRGWVKNVPV
jgi:hypothetical protein